MTDPIELLIRRINKADNGSIRPFVTLSYAQSLDGCLTEKAGKSFPLSGREAMVMTHQLRASHEGILIGIETALVDNPQLTVRHVKGPTPQPVILDTHLRLPLDSSLMVGETPPWIATSHSVDAEQVALFETRGASVIRVPESVECVDLSELLQLLAQRGIRRLMVEGGRRVISSFLEHKLVDLVVLTISPRILGGVPAIDRHSIMKLDGGPTLSNPTWCQLGSDMILWGEPRWVVQ